MEISDNKVAKANLSPEDKDLILDLKHTDHYKVIIKLLNLLAHDQADALLKTDLRVTSDRELSLSKARLEGAEKIVRDFHAITQKTARQVK